MSKSFVFNDQNQTNSYGFRILTEGISLKRFKKNPVMLNQHWNSTNNVLGKWQNLTLKDELLLGEPLFDIEDEEGKRVSGKVERGFINSCSMGVTFKREDLKMIGNEIILEKCELYECSIVAVPSNANSIRLYNQEGKLLEDKEVKELCLSITSESPLKDLTQNLKIMNKIVLQVAALVALGFDKALKEIEQKDLEDAILALHKENAELKAENLKLETAASKAQEKEVESMVELAIKEGRILAAKKDEFVKLGNASFDLLKSTLEAIPVKTILSGKETPGTPNEVITKDEFQKLSLDEQLAFKTNNPEAFKKLFNPKK